MSHQTIRVSDGNDFVELRLLEHGLAGTPSEGDVRLGVSVRCGTFGGEYDQVWIARDEWASFLAALRRLERDRTDRATLRSMSPDEFEMHLQIVDRAGHLAAHGCLSRYSFRHQRERTTRSRVEYDFDVDPSLLRELVLSFEALGQRTE